LASFKIKQKISLARTLYSNADIYILNDPLSCFDEDVEKQMFDEIFSPSGILKKKVIKIEIIIKK
jgi:ATP-binding cassette, subfamily C (CFTR/MRP), member 1